MSSEPESSSATGSTDKPSESPTSSTLLGRVQEHLLEQASKVVKFIFFPFFVDNSGGRERSGAICCLEGLGAGILTGAGVGALRYYGSKDIRRARRWGLLCMWLFGIASYSSCRAPEIARLTREKQQREMDMELREKGGRANTDVQVDDPIS